MSIPDCTPVRGCRRPSFTARRSISPARSTTNSIRSAISSPAKSTSRDALPHWPNGAPSRPNGRLGLGVLRPTQTTGHYYDKALRTIERRESTYCERSRPRPWPTELRGQRPIAGDDQRDRRVRLRSLAERDGCADRVVCPTAGVSRRARCNTQTSVGLTWPARGGCPRTVRRHVGERHLERHFQWPTGLFAFRKQ
jgi:hypothetical protein